MSDEKETKTSRLPKIRAMARERWDALPMDKKIARCKKIAEGYPDDHPQLVAINKQIAFMEKQMEAIKAAFRKKDRKI